MTATTIGAIGRAVSRRGQYLAWIVFHCDYLLCVLPHLLRHLILPRKLIVSAVAAALVLAPLPAAFGHERLELAGQADISALDALDHGHSHDDEEGNGNAAGHSHNGHDPADHSHQFAFLGVGMSQGVSPLPERWPSLQNGTPDQAAGCGIDRPPKRAV